jgi:hypothetical protein
LKKVRCVSREVEKVYLMKLAKPHKVNWCVGAMAIKEEQSISTIGW